MAYIGKVKIPSEWTSLESLIKAQVSGQSSFAFSTSSTYSLQADGADKAEVRLCNATSAPTDEMAGEHIDRDQFGKYEPASGATLYVKQNGALVYLSVSEI